MTNSFRENRDRSSTLKNSSRIDLKKNKDRKQYQNFFAFKESMINKNEQIIVLKEVIKMAKKVEKQMK